VVRYVARWRDRDRWRGKTYDTYDDAEAYLQQIGRDRRSGRYTPDADLTIAQMLDDYLRRGERRWSPNTTANYRQIARSILVPALGKKKVRDLTPRHVQDFIDDLGQQYSPR